MQLVKHNPIRIYLAARNEASSQKAISDIETEVPGSASLIQYIHCDLTSLTSVEATAHAFLKLEKERVGDGGQPRLDLLVLNAGVMAVPAGLTKDGYEIQFGTNHLGHFLLNKLLLPTLLATTKLPAADVRVISLTSFGHLVAPWRGIVFDSLRSPMAWTPTLMRYAQSKLANILFAKEVQRRFSARGITAVAVHPGVVDTQLYRTVISTWWLAGSVVDIVRRTLYLSVQDGAKGQLWAATAPLGDSLGQVKGGEYYEPLGLTGLGSGLSNNAELALKLWEWSEKEVERYD